MRACLGRSRWLVAALVAAASPASIGSARAEGRDVAARLTAYEAEARRLGADLPQPNQIPTGVGQRRLVDAEVAYSLGDYDAAALALFDLASRPGPDREAASFYLAESLFQKGDRGTAAGNYEQVVRSGGAAGRYYQPSLERLIEIAIVQKDDAKDDAKIDAALAALDRVPAGQRLPSVPYIRGKLAYARGKFADALEAFQEVPKGSDAELQASYYAGTTYVAKGDLARATAVFTDLIGRKPRTANDRRMIELAQLALGRLYYERDQASKSIDSYLLVDRHSDLFPDALYEVAWVYVKGKQYDKALRALELLAKADPQSTKTPTVKILEGNLRIRKAQMVRTAQILGTIDAKAQDDPAAEYDRAVQVFTETHDAYLPSYNALAQMASGGASPEMYLRQIVGRFEHVFQIAAPIPEAAVQYLRDEPQVQRVVRVETDLSAARASIADAEGTIARLEAVLATRDRTALYPELAGRRARIAAIEAELIQIRNDLAETQAGRVANPELAGLTASRRQRFAAFAAMADPDRIAADHLARNQARYDAIERSAVEVDDAIAKAQAMAVALRTYVRATPDLPADQGRAMSSALDAAAREAEVIENELHAVREELALGRDLAGVGDPSAAAAAAARRQVRAAEDAEQNLLVRLAGSSKDHERLAAMAGRATRLAAQLAETERQIDAIVGQGLQEARAMLASEKAAVAAARAELARDEAEARALGANALAQSFQNVKAKFYDIVIRTDVGNVDAAWSQKADVDDDLKRLNLSRQRELKQLRDEFKDVLEAAIPKPSAPTRRPAVPAPEATAPITGSPDKGAGDQRIAPVRDQPGTPAPPMVKPDEAPGPAAQAVPKQPRGTSEPRGKPDHALRPAAKAASKQPGGASAPKKSGGSGGAP